MRNLLTHSIIFFALFYQVNAQVANSFKTDKSFYLYGDALVIGNNSLSKATVTPFNELSVTNDDIPMSFVDIDKDNSTFNSSASILQLPDYQTSIVYAALYWTATFSYIKGERRLQNGQLFFSGERQKDRSLISKVKLKLPNQQYQTIKGKVLFDGYRKSGFHLNSPYACYADITDLLQNAQVINGQITVANIHATEGFVSGGSSAGWMLYVVYEAPTEKPKYMTIFNGFAHIGTEPVVINLKNFKAPEKGHITTNLTLAALEGDLDITEDECIIANTNLKTAIRLSTDERAETNFFNSSIDNKIIRIPNSKNTLGFDIARLKIPDNKETIIDHNTDNVELLFNTKEDQFYLFFTAFETEISQSFFEEIETNIPENATVIKSIKLEEKIDTQSKTDLKIVSLKNEIKPKTLSLKAPNKIEYIPTENALSPKVATSNYQQEQIKQSNVIISSSTYVEALKIKERPLETQQFKLILEKNAAEIEGAKKGYYVITKFFSSPENAFNWKKELKEKGIKSDFLIDENNKLYYVYIFHTENFYDAYMQHKSFIKEAIFKDNWVFKVNMSDF